MAIRRKLIVWVFAALNLGSIYQQKKIIFYRHTKDQPIRFIVWTHEEVRVPARGYSITQIMQIAAPTNK